MVSGRREKSGLLGFFRAMCDAVCGQQADIVRDIHSIGLEG